METYGKILLIAMPFFLAFVLLEQWYGWRKGTGTINTADTISSLLSGITNVTKDVLGLSIAIYGYGWMVEHLALYRVPTGWFTYFIAFIALDLSGYLVHRIQHRYNFFWNGHLVHHSSEEFNLACALRQSISGLVKIFAVFLLPAALLGVPEKVIAIVAPLHLFAQFWYHTTHIRKMGLLEKIIVTPSHHRVHHAINPEYLDKNYAQIFIFWDKWFGTFQEELPDKPPVYGITRPVLTWNPVKINFQHVWLLIQDAWHTQSWRDKCRIWLMPTGWRPADVADKYPICKIDNVYAFRKYETLLDPFMQIWVWIQLGLLLLVVSYLLSNIAAIGSPGIFLYGLFIFLFVYSLAELMDNNIHAWVWEFTKTIYGTPFILYGDHWMPLPGATPAVRYLVVAYLVGSAIISLCLCINFKKQQKALR